MYSTHVSLTRFETEALGSGKMAQWVKAPIAKPADVSLILGTLRVEGENWLPQVVLCPPTQTKNFKKIKQRP